MQRELSAIFGSIDGGDIYRFDEDQSIYAQGDRADCFFYVRSGRVKLSVISDEGKEAIIGLINEGRIFGESCLADPPVRYTHATALDPTELVVIPRDTVTQRLRDGGAYPEEVIAYLLRRFAEVLHRSLVEQLFHSSEERLAHLLLQMAEDEGAGEYVLLRVRQETLAEMIGTTRPRVSHFMTKFRRLGLVQYRKGLHVSPSMLRALLRKPRRAG